MAADDSNPSRSALYSLMAAAPAHWLFRVFPPATRAELWGGLALLVLSLLGGAWVLKCRSDDLALEQDSVIVQGKVLRLWVTSGKRSSTCHVAYEYQAPGEAKARTFQGETRLDDEHFARLTEGGLLAVKV